MPSLTIVIPSHSRADLLQACLASVAQHAPTGTEIIVVDDGSPAEMIVKSARAFPGVKTIRLTKRRGFCVAANVGIGAASGDIVEMLNDDTEVMADWAEAALDAFREPTVAAVAPLVLLRPSSPGDLTRIDSAGDRYYLGGVAGKRGHGQPVGLEPMRRCRVFGASASSAFYRRDLLLSVGAFPESFGAYFEDVDVAFRLHQAGYEVVFEPESRVWHRGAASHGRNARCLLEQQSCNEERVFWRNLPRATLMRALPLHLAVLAGKAWKRWQEGCLVPFLAGRMKLLGELPELLKHRRGLRGKSPVEQADQWMVETRFWGGSA